MNRLFLLIALALGLSASAADDLTILRAMLTGETQSRQIKPGEENPFAAAKIVGQFGPADLRRLLAENDLASLQTLSRASLVALFERANWREFSASQRRKVIRSFEALAGPAKRRWFLLWAEIPTISFNGLLSATSTPELWRFDLETLCAIFRRVSIGALDESTRRRLRAWHLGMDEPLRSQFADALVEIDLKKSIASLEAIHTSLTQTVTPGEVAAKFLGPAVGLGITVYAGCAGAEASAWVTAGAVILGWTGINVMGCFPGQLYRDEIVGLLRYIDRLLRYHAGHQLEMTVALAAEIAKIPTLIQQLVEIDAFSRSENSRTVIKVFQSVAVVSAWWPENEVLKAAGAEAQKLSWILNSKWDSALSPTDEPQFGLCPFFLADFAEAKPAYANDEI